MAASERTIEQRQVIEHRNGDLLVSASAGSGKTTVLIDHVMALVLDEEHPVEVDRLLIATFTKAAAEEMKTRLAAAIDARIKEGSPDAARLRRQRLLIPHAHISTLDSFYNWLVRNYYHKLKIDPDFRMGDDGEMKLMQKDTADVLFEKLYQKGDPGFLGLVDSYGGDKNDEDLKKDVINLYGFAQSSPDPDEWLRNSARIVEAGLEDPVIHDCVRMMKADLSDMKDRLRQAIDTLTPSESKLLPRLTEEYAMLENLDRAEDISTFLRLLHFVSFNDLPRIGSKDKINAEWSAIDLRNTIKKIVKEQMREKFGMENPVLINDLAPAVAVHMRAFVDLTIDFGKAFTEAKQEKNILDYGDVSHLVLQLLRENEDIAAELRNSFEEIIIDEFQDINRLQEEILQLLSGSAQGRHDRFMVGDVKQSIYGFRMAEPDIFQDKYETFSPAEGSDHRKIDLNANFRSRREVLDAVNAIFSRVMTKECGRVDYQGSAMLKYGAKDYEEAPDDRYKAELILVEKPEDKEDDAEIREIANRIKELTDPATGLQIFDKKEKITRLAEYRDIVVLARSAHSVSADYVAALREAGIPAAADKKAGFFTAPEIVLICSMLKIIDDPRQDIPLMSVLVSPMFGLDEDLILNLQLDHRAGEKRGTLNDTLYDALLFSDDSRVKNFIETLNRYRDYAGYHSIHELISLILEDTGYLYYASALTDGGIRQANIEMLLERAIDFEATSYSGIFQFNRYIEQLKKYEIDYGEGDSLREQDNIVRVLSVHQSKGLEYPIVFLADCSHQYNDFDSSASIPHHPRYGIRANYMDRERNIKVNTLSKGALGYFIKRRNREEELRILYVAMTRAREKLIITGTETKKKGAETPGKEYFFADKTTLPPWLIFSFSNNLSLIKAAIGENTTALNIIRKTENEIEKDEESRIRDILQNRREMESLDPETTYDAALKEQLEKIKAFAYPWQSATENRSVYAVSDLKKKATERDLVIRADGDEGAEDVLKRDEVIRTDGDEGAEDAAKRGTAYHLLMSKVDPERGTEILYIKEMLAKLMKQGQIEPDIGAQLHPEWIRSYYTTPIGKRTADAHREGRLYREKPFILGKPADVVDPSNSPDDTVMIKGVIDNFFIEDDGIVLVDYKTDRIRPGEEGLLADRYRTQLVYYAQALENAFKRPIKEMYLYSFALGKTIEVRP
ncbi:MAG: helicase-exonuclease AddAB subunit AddA [Lachnospiraceae bacterium]|nr:helicase-exonuclease AddAB subunit AddA [Lachnospiraceae bacterium]